MPPLALLACPSGSYVVDVVGAIGESAPSYGSSVFSYSGVSSVHVVPSYSGSSFCGVSVVRDYVERTAAFSNVIVEPDNIRDYIYYTLYTYALST